MYADKSALPRRFSPKNASDWLQGMPDLLKLLRDYDLGQLQIVAGLWGLELKSGETDKAASELAAAVLDPQLATELISSLKIEARTALQKLAATGGRIPWAVFTREFGEVREMGAGRRDREKPYQKSISPAEDLFYRAFLGRAFFDSEDGPQEFAFIPDDWLPLIQHDIPAGTIGRQPFGRQATIAESACVTPATDRILDEATSMLAAERTRHPVQPDPVLQGLLHAADLLKDGELLTSRVKVFLELQRPDALRLLEQAWREDESYDELRLIPGLICEGQWSSDPLATRRFVLRLLDSIPPMIWWSLEAFISDVKKECPDFQRPAGDYDSWFIKTSADGRYQRGYESWDQVDGALLRFLIGVVMYRLGILDVASSSEGAHPLAFRIIRDRPQPFIGAENGKLRLTSRGMITATRHVPRTVRYQVARFCEWVEEKSDEYRYRVTPRSLTRAREQGLLVEQMVSLLAKNSEAGIPPVLVKALKRWDADGTEAWAETQVVLKVRKPEIIQQLRRSKAARFLGEQLGPTTVVVKAGAVQKVAEAMTELGVLLEDETNQSA